MDQLIAAGMEAAVAARERGAYLPILWNSCDHNSAANAFDESMDGVEKMLASLPEMKQMLTASYGRDKAETMCRGLLESSIGDIVSAFQKFAACHYDKLTGKTSRVTTIKSLKKEVICSKMQPERGTKNGCLTRNCVK